MDLIGNRWDDNRPHPTSPPFFKNWGVFRLKLGPEMPPSVTSPERQNLLMQTTKVYISELVASQGRAFALLDRAHRLGGVERQRAIWILSNVISYLAQISTAGSSGSINPKDSMRSSVVGGPNTSYPPLSIPSPTVGRMKLAMHTLSPSVWLAPCCIK